MPHFFALLKRLRLCRKIRQLLFYD